MRKLQTLLLLSLVALPVVGVSLVFAASSTAFSSGATLNSPPISGELLSLGAKTDVKTFAANGTQISVEGNRLKAIYQTDTTYPNVGFPVPEGGWNLSAFAGVQIEVMNPGKDPVIVNLRVDNAGDWKDNPWNTAGVRVAAGETKTLQIVFGRNEDGTPSYPLDPNRIVAMQVFLVSPTQQTTLFLSGLKAFGSAAERADVKALSVPADRTKPVALPAWLGKRPPVAGNWIRTFNDDFNGTSLDAKFWEVGGSGEPNPQYTNRYAKENAIVEDGFLKIRAEKKAGHHYNQPEAQTREYTTANVITDGKWTQLYGYFECRAKLPTARGLWPAFWMMPDRGVLANDPGGWKSHSTGEGGMEFDILEHLTEWGKGRNNVAAHWDGYGADHKSWGDANVFFGTTRDDFHTFGMLWEPGKLTWYIDGFKKSEWKNERVGSVPCYLILCTQMGGWATKDVDVAKLPDDFIIDYVRVWQLKDRIKP